jgi:hypothetical protein
LVVINAFHVDKSGVVLPDVSIPKYHSGGVVPPFVLL